MRETISAPSRGGLGWALLAGGLLLFLILGDVPEKTLFWDALFDEGHVPLFGLLALAALRWLRARRPAITPARAWWTAFAVAAVIGVATELIQFLQPAREPSAYDLARDVAGAGAFLLVAAVFGKLGGGTSPISTRRARGGALTVAAILLIASVATLAGALAVLAQRDAAMPTLFRFDGSWWERSLIRRSHSALTPGAKPRLEAGAIVEPLARLDLERGTYPGITLREPYPDWRGYHRLVVTVVSDLEGPFSLVIRVHDALHDQRAEDRFNRALIIAPGVNRFAIPLDEIRTAPDLREMDLSRIRGIIIFGYRVAAPVHVFLGPLRLE